MFRKLLAYYDDRPFVVDGELDLTTNVTTITNMLQPEGFQPNNTYQEVAGIALYPYDYFCPRDIHTLKLVVTENTYTIHHFAGSWLPKEDVERQNYKRRKNWLEQKFGVRMANIYESLYYSGKKRGGDGVFRFVCGIIKRKLF